MEHHDLIASLTVSALDVKLPPFCTSDTALSFVQAENSVRRISTDSTKYHEVVANTPPATVNEVSDILCAPPAEDVYQVFEKALIRRLAPLEPERFQQLLRKP